MSHLLNITTTTKITLVWDLERTKYKKERMNEKSAYVVSNMGHFNINKANHRSDLAKVVAAILLSSKTTTK